MTDLFFSVCPREIEIFEAKEILDAWIFETPLATSFVLLYLLSLPTSFSIRATRRVSLSARSRAREILSPRKDARGAAAISTGSAVSRARASTLRRTFTGTRGERGNATSHSTTTRVNKQCVSLSLSLLTTRRG